jgi:glyoxalase family protein
MVHRIVWRVSGEPALDFWEERLRGESVTLSREDGRIRFSDPEGLGLELAAVETDEEPLMADSPEIPAEHALQGFDGVRAYADDPERSARFLSEGTGFSPDGDGEWRAQGEKRSSLYVYDRTPDRGFGGAGTVHHVAWASPMEDHEAWRDRVAAAGAQPTPIIDRFWFKSIYFREPSGVLFEIATIGPGFTTDEPLEHLGETLTLPPDFEHLRPRLEQVLTPLPDLSALRSRS